MMIPLRLLFCFLFITLGFSCVFAQHVAADPVRLAVEKIATREGMKHAAWGFVVLEAITGKVVHQLNPDLGLVPASILKLAITYPAWQSLGPDYRFTTSLQVDAGHTAGILNGNVYIKGDGDPCLGSARFSSGHPDSLFLRWGQVLRKAGITEIGGGVIGDADVFEDDIIPGEWMWNDIGNYYGAGASGLNFHENSLDLVFNPGDKEGSPVRLSRLDPMLHGLEFDNQLTTGKRGSGDQVVIYGAPFSASRLLRGTVPLGENDFIVRGSFPDPALAAAQLFEQYLKSTDLVVQQEAASTRQLRNRAVRISQSRTMLDSVVSPPLSDIIRAIHYKSINTYAEALVKKMGEKVKHKATTAAGLDFVLEFWKLRGLDVRGIALFDGCGLSPMNRISAMQMAGMMRIMVNDKSAAQYLKTLSVAGKSGDLKAILTESPAMGNLIGKSGYMKSVRSYCGTLKDKQGKALVFTVIVNNYEGESPALRKLLEELMLEIARSGE